MTQIYVSNGCAKLYKDIANALDASYIDYDMDGYGRYMVNEDDADEVSYRKGKESSGLRF